MAKAGTKVNPTQIRLEEIEKEIAELSEKRNSLVSHWNLERDLIKSIRSAKQEIEDLRTEADKFEREGNLAKVAEIIGEECIYFKAGQYTALIYPIKK